jgi:prepilin-type processing-associated H-X9-DG protein
VTQNDCTRLRTLRNGSVCGASQSLVMFPLQASVWTRMAKCTGQPRISLLSISTRGDTVAASITHEHPNPSRMKKRLCFAGVVLCFGAMAGLLFLSANRANDSARASACQGCLTSIAVAMHKYHERHGHFPPAYQADASGKPAHSWRVLLLEFLDHELYAAYKFDEPWNGPTNRKLESRMPSCYACPADREDKARWRTSYFVVVGEATIFPGSTTIALKDLKRPSSSTILLVESIGQDIHWMEPKDLSFDSMSFVVNDSSKPSVSSRHRNGPNVCMADGTKQRLVQTTPETLRAMLMTGPNCK